METRTAVGSIQTHFSKLGRPLASGSDGGDADFARYAHQTPASPGKISSPLISNGVMEAMLRMDETGSLYSQSDTDLLNSRKVLDVDRQRFGEIFQDAVSNGAFNNPVEYVKSLSQEDIGVLQRIHSIASPSGVTQSNVEGAVNLLLPPKTVVDLNNDGLVNKGASTMFQFPPPNAPQSVKDAWAMEVEGLDEWDRVIAELPFFTMTLSANINIDDQGRFVSVTEPNTPGYKNPFPTSEAEWLNLIEEKISEFKGAAQRTPSLQESLERFERLYSRLSESL